MKQQQSEFGPKVYLVGVGLNGTTTKKIYVGNGLIFWPLKKREGLQKTSDFGKTSLERINVRFLREFNYKTNLLTFLQTNP